MALDLECFAAYTVADRFLGIVGHQAF